MSLEKAKAFLLKTGDILFARSGATVGKTFQFKNYEGLACYAGYLIKATPDSRKVLSDFLYFYTKSNAYENWKNSIFNQSTIQNIGAEKYSALEIPIPQLAEQISINEYLNKKTDEIDKLIASKKQLIELLNEERVAIINQAVTKGINPKAKLKPSGIKWLGDIPSHWEVKKLKYLVSKVGSGITPKGGANVYQTDGIPLLRSQNIYSDRLELTDIAFISEEMDKEMASSRVQVGDVLLNITGASIGRCFYIHEGFGKGNVNQHVCIIRPVQEKISTKFLHAILMSEFGQTMLELCQNGSNREGINYQQIKSFDLLLPKLEEQKEIIEFIQTKIDRINSIVSKIEFEIELMIEYRAALITELVTGKINVM